MTADEFVHEVTLVTHVALGEPKRSELVKLFQRVRDDTAYELAQAVDKQRTSIEKERFSGEEN